MIYDEIKITTAKDKLEELSFKEKLNELLHEKAETKCFKDLLQNDNSLKDELLDKIFDTILSPIAADNQTKDLKDEAELNYYL